jgi:hypothetical protein
VLIVLVGKKSHSATGVLKEIGFAKENDVPNFGVYVDGANTQTDLPTGLNRSRVISWGWEEIANCIDQCMKEGKNK